MVDMLAPDGLAEAIERARFALLRQGTWSDLREGERTTRIQILRSALDASGVTVRLQALELRAAQSTELADLHERREADFRRRLADDDAEIVRLSDTIRALTERLVAASTERDAAVSAADENATRLVRIRDVLDGVHPAEVPAQGRAQEKADPTARRAPHRAAKTRLSIATGP